MKTNLKLCVYNEMAEEEVFIDFSFDLDMVNGHYNCPVDPKVVNLISYGQLYTVKKTHELMMFLNTRYN